MLNIRMRNPMVNYSSLRRHYPEQVNGYYLSLSKRSTPEIQTMNKNNFEMLSYSSFKLFSKFV